MGPPTTIVKPEMEYEGRQPAYCPDPLPVCYEAMNAVRDPAVDGEGDRVYLLNFGKCEVGGIVVPALYLMKVPARSSA